MSETVVHTLDLNFQGQPGTIAAYLLPYTAGGVLIESGPGSTIPGLQRALAVHDLTVHDITDVLLTHIHLDHAGAAGWLARQGARIHVHPVGAPHLLDPSKLLASATRLYGDRMDQLWGEFLPVPADKLNILEDNAVVEIGAGADALRIRALDTPGHASHHFVYICGDICFSGDIGGVRVGGKKHLRLPMPPPEFQLEQWRKSLARMETENFQRIAPTHFGIYADCDWHLSAIANGLERVETWMKAVMPGDPPLESLRQQYIEWETANSISQGIDDLTIREFEIANPSFMSADGIQRYWRKNRTVANNQ